MIEKNRGKLFGERKETERIKIEIQNICQQTFQSNLEHCISACQSFQLIKFFTMTFRLIPMARNIPTCDVYK